jgi:hypothetical protein
MITFGVIISVIVVLCVVSVLFLLVVSVVVLSGCGSFLWTCYGVFVIH